MSRIYPTSANIAPELTEATLGDRGAIPPDFYWDNVSSGELRPEDWDRVANQLGRLVEQASRDNATLDDVIAKLRPTEARGAEVVFKELDNIRGFLQRAAKGSKDRARWFQEREDQACALLEALHRELSLRERGAPD